MMYRLNSGDFLARKSNIENFSEIILFIDRLKTNQFQLDNIVVKINYRLGIMGFMNTFDEEKGVPKGGNYGYMDQGAAIKDSFTIIKNA